MKRLSLLPVMFLCIVLIAHVVKGQVMKQEVVQETRYLQYEGVLTDRFGEKMSGEYTMMFRLYDSPTSPAHLWEETHRVEVRDGEFRVTLGQSSPLPPVEEEFYRIGVFIDGEELSPRHPVRLTGGDETVVGGMVIPAARVTVDPPVAEPYGVGDGGGWTDDGTVVRLTTSTDSVGIGTANPSARLHVEGNETAVRVNSSSFSGNSNYGVKSETENAGDGPAHGGHFSTTSEGTGDHAGVTGEAYHATSDSDGAAMGVWGTADHSGVGEASGGHFSAAPSGTGVHYGVRAQGYGGSSSDAYGSHAYAENTSDGDAVGTYGYAKNTGSGDAIGGYFEAADFGTGRHCGVEVRAQSSLSGPLDPLYGIGVNVYPISLNSYAMGGLFHVDGAVSESYYIAGINVSASRNSDSRIYGLVAEAISYSASGGTNPMYGVYGYADDYMYNDAPTYGVYGYAASMAGAAAVYAAGDLVYSGSLIHDTITSRGHRLLYAQESTEQWIEDFGEGRLENGSARIDLDPLFLETVTIDAEHPMKVFIQLRDDCRGTYVRTGETGFDVHELQGGESHAAFSYRVVAKRKGYEEERMAETQLGYDDPYLYPEVREKMRDEIEAKRLSHARDRE